MKVVKVYFKPYQKNALLGFADIEFAFSKNATEADVTLSGFSLFKKDGEFSLSFPQRKEISKEGKTEYFPIFKFKETELSETWQKSVLDAVKKAFEQTKPSSGTKTNKSSSPDLEDDGLMF